MTNCQKSAVIELCCYGAIFVTVMIWAYFENKSMKKRTADMIQEHKNDFNRRVRLMEQQSKK